MHHLPRITTRRRFLPLLIATAAALAATAVYAADGDPDPAFTKLCASSFVQSIATKSDGKILVGGQFTIYDGILRNRIAQLNADGTLDGAFDVGSVEEGFGSVEAIAVQSDGKVLIGGSFTPHNEPSFVNGAPNFVAIERLNATGSLDLSFNFDGYGNSSFNAIAVQGNGQIVVGGTIASDDGTVIDRLARLNADGSIDWTFSRGIGQGFDVFSITLQPDGKFLIGGSFSTYGGAPTPNIARLNADGSRDTSFNPGSGPNGSVYTTSVQADGKIIIGGGFSAVANQSHVGIARLNADGSLDPTFDAGTGVDGAVLNSAVQFDGKIVITGQFNSYNGVARGGIARINPDGSLDLAFNPGPPRVGGQALVLQSDGKILTDFAGFVGSAFCGSVGRLLSTPPPPPPNPGPPLPAPTGFTVNGSATGVPVPADSVLRMRVAQTANAPRLTVRVQSSTTPQTETSWTDLNNGSFGRMIFDVTNDTWVLNTTSYPRGSNVHFRVVSAAPGTSSSVSNEVGPFNLTSTTPNLGRTILGTTRNGIGAKINFRAFDDAHPAGTSMRIQTATSPGDESNWTDLADGNGGRMAPYRNPGDFYLDSKNYPANGALYFRAVASAPGYVDSPSRGVGPFNLTNSPSPAASITSPGVSGSGAGTDFEFPVQLASGIFTINANAAPNGGPAISRIVLRLDGETIASSTSGSISYTFPANAPAKPGDHVIEAVASDELGVSGDAVPVFIRIVPGSGKFYQRLADGAWNDAAKWLDHQGNSGVPGAGDLAVIGTFNVSLTQNVTALAVSLNGGSVDGPGALTITGTFTVGGGKLPIRQLTIAPGATLLFVNESDVGLLSSLANQGTVRLIGRAGIDGIDVETNGATKSGDALRPADFQRFWGALVNEGRFDLGLLLGGKREAPRANPTPTPSPTPAVPKTIVFASVLNQGGNIISNDGASLVNANSAALAGAPIISNDGASVVFNGSTIISNDGASLLGQDGAGIISGGGGNLVALGSGGLPRVSDGTSGTTPSSGFVQTAGTTNLNGMRLIGAAAFDGGILTGNGVIEGDLANGGGTVTPGNSAGSITVTGAFSQGANGTLSLEIGGTNPNTPDFDQLKIAGTAALGGNLAVNTINGFTPNVNQPFVPLSYAAITGTFAATTGNVQVSLNDTGANLAVTPAALARRADTARPSGRLYPVDQTSTNFPG
jgi:uncharacterized delta-60 repeat protein